MQFIDLKSRHELIGNKINARIQKVMDHGQFILGPEVQRALSKSLLSTQVQSIVSLYRVEQILYLSHLWH